MIVTAGSYVPYSSGTETDAAGLLQRMWRGFVTRRSRPVLQRLSTFLEVQDDPSDAAATAGERSDQPESAASHPSLAVSAAAASSDSLDEGRLPETVTHRMVTYLRMVSDGTPYLVDGDDWYPDLDRMEVGHVYFFRGEDLLYRGRDIFETNQGLSLRFDSFHMLWSDVIRF